MGILGRAGRGATIGILTFILGMGFSGREARTQKTGSSQNPGVQMPDPFGLPQQDQVKQGDSPFGDTRAKQARLRDEERQKRLVADTEKLLELATSLHEDVAKTNRNILSVDVVKRADEIEKLAHSVKEKMKG
jgi:hypothetical protein